MFDREFFSVGVICVQYDGNKIYHGLCQHYSVALTINEFAVERPVVSTSTSQCLKMIQ